jgi:hypothetical protein
MKYKCDKCKELHRAKGLLFVKGKYLCFHCRNKTVNKSMNEISNHLNKGGYISLEKALEREYVVKSYIKKGNYNLALITVPSCLGGYVVKLSLVKK